MCVWLGFHFIASFFPVCTVSLHRGRRTFEEEQRVMADVRRLRETLAQKNRQKKPVPPYRLED